MSRNVKFWGSAVGAALLFAALVPVLFPYGALGLDRAADRPRVWLLTVFCAGIMAVAFGVSGVIGGRFLGVRDVLEAKSYTIAAERQKQAMESVRERGWMNAGTWTVAAGASLLATYFVLLAALG